MDLAHGSKSPQNGEKVCTRVDLDLRNRKTGICNSRWDIFGDIRLSNWRLGTQHLRFSEACRSVFGIHKAAQHLMKKNKSFRNKWFCLSFLNFTVFKKQTSHYHMFLSTTVVEEIFKARAHKCDVITIGPISDYIEIHIGKFWVTIFFYFIYTLTIILTINHYH